MFRLFARYASVGVVNTLIHWITFFIVYAFWPRQSLANLTAFSLAVTFSFLANARWTFKAKATPAGYLLYVAFMAVMATAVGWGADSVHMPALLTLILFSLISLFCGFAWSKLFIFRRKI